MRELRCSAELLHHGDRRLCTDDRQARTRHVTLSDPEHPTGLELPVDSPLQPPFSPGSDAALEAAPRHATRCDIDQDRQLGTIQLGPSALTYFAAALPIPRASSGDLSAADEISLDTWARDSYIGVTRINPHPAAIVFAISRAVDPSAIRHTIPNQYFSELTGQRNKPTNSILPAIRGTHRRLNRLFGSIPASASNSTGR